MSLFLLVSILFRLLLCGAGEVGEARGQPGQRHRAVGGGGLPWLPGALRPDDPALLPGRPQQAVSGGTTPVINLNRPLFVHQIVG